MTAFSELMNYFCLPYLVQILRKAVMGMLSKNNLRYSIGRKLRIFPGQYHLHTDMLPEGTPSILV